MRKLVSVQKVASINPIEKADRIEKVSILGWNVVVGKGEFTVGELVAYFEVDSFLRDGEPIFADLQKRSQRNFFVNGEFLRGHVLRTAKLRGVVSQGLAMKLSNIEPFLPDGMSLGDLSEGDDITNFLGVVKFEEPIPQGGNIIGSFDSRFAPKSDSVRVQNLAPIWEDLKSVEWEATLKVDGTSQTIVNDNGQLRIFSRNRELALQESLGYIAARDSGLLAVVEDNEGVAIQFELVGPGIQSNRLKLDRHKPVVFDVWVNRVKIPRNQWPSDLAEISAPILGLTPNGTLEDFIQQIDGIRGNYTPNVLDEGVVFHPVNPDELPERVSLALGENKTWKIISNKFLLKNGE